MRLLQRSYKDPFEVLTAEEALHRGALGGNAGNLLFSEAAQKILTTPDTSVDVDPLTSPKGLAARINAEYDGLVVPLANAFRDGFRPGLRRLTRLIEQLDVPVVVLGVGAQAGVDGDLSEMADLDDDVRAFVSAVLDRGPSIGVRGEFTADYLTHLGFKDVEVIGCPSMFRHGPVFPAITPTPVTPSSTIAVNGAHRLFRGQGLDRFVQRLVERFPDTTFIGQNTAEGMQLRWRDLSGGFGGLAEVPTHPEHPLYRAGRARMYVDPTTWIDDLRGFDYSIGGRIHGTIGALLAGTPAVLLAGDARTLELSRYFDIPHHLLRSLSDDVDPAALLEEADWTALHAGHGARWDRFVAYLDRHGLPNAFTHGDGGQAFEDRLAGLDLPAPITPSTLSDLEASRAHVAWLRDELATVERELRRERRRGAPTPARPDRQSAGGASRLLDRIRSSRRPG